MALRLAIACRQVSGVTGTTTTILEHSRRLVELGWEVHVYGDELDAGRLRACGAVAHSLPRWPWGGGVRRRLFSWWFERIIGRGRFGLVWGHGDSLTQDVLSLHNCVHAAHEAVHGRPLPEDSSVGRLHARILSERRFRLVIANSELMKGDLVGRYGLPEETVAVVRPGYDPERFRPGDRPAVRGPARRELGLRQDDLVLGMITSGDFRKRGVDVFLRALGILRREGLRGLRALVIGKESRLSPYLELAASEGVADVLQFLPPRGDIQRYYHALDVYVHPARYEEFGQSVQEAMACGLPVVAGSKVGACELLPDEGRRFLLGGPEPEELAGRLRELALNEGLRGRLGQRGAAAAAGNTWDDNFRATMDALKPILAAKEVQ